MTILETVLLILFGASFLGNIAQFVFGVKIENNQTQIVQSYNVNINDNQNLNLVNTSFILTNAYIASGVTNGVTNFRIVYPLISTNLKITERLMSAITNQSNKTQVGLFPHK